MSLSFSRDVQSMAFLNQVSNLFPVKRRRVHAERNPTELADVRSEDEARIFEEEFLVNLLHTKAKAPLLFKCLKNGECRFPDPESRMSPPGHLIGFIE